MGRRSTYKTWDAGCQRCARPGCDIVANINRHTYASMMLTSGKSPVWVASQMGHADWSMIGRIYGRWIKDATPEAGKKAVEMFSK